MTFMILKPTPIWMIRFIRDQEATTIIKESKDGKQKDLSICCNSGVISALNGFVFTFLNKTFQ